MKKLVSLILTAALLGALGIPAAAEPAPDTADQRLTKVTATVKRTLGIGDEYTEFSGELWENALAPTWNLNWSREDGNLSVEATESGKILSYYRSDSESGIAVSPGRGSFAPSFPATTRAEAETAAKNFVSKVFSSQETAVFKENANVRLNTGSHRFSGEILLNGLPSPLSFSVTVRAADGVVTAFYRDSLESTTIGAVPSAKPAAAKGTAGALLKDTLSLRLEYVLEEDGEGEARTAVLRYLPEQGDEFYVDAQTGKLVNLTELYKKANEEGFASNGSTAPSADMAAPEAMAAGGDAGLSRVEQEGIAKLEGVLSKEALDKELQGITALGLSKYTLGSASYSVDKETGDVTVRMTYSRRDSDGTWRRSVLCDGKTGDLLGVSSSAPYSRDRGMSVSGDKAQEIGSAFLAGLWGDDFAQTELYDSVLWESGGWGVTHSFSFAQKENGYFLPANSLSVGVDVTDGSISDLNRDWVDGVTFDSPEGIVDEAAALDAWFNYYDVALAYRSIPVQLDPGMAGVEPLMEAGYAYFYGLKLSYALEEDGNGRGVDAKTGEVVLAEPSAGRAVLTYSDLDSHWVKAQAETMAMYGIGWQGGAFRPDQTLTQLDLVALLVSTNGYLFDPETGAADDLYGRAYDMGILTRADRRDEAPVTRGEMVKLLLDGLGYGEAAAFKGIYAASYADWDQIPAELQGYAALAQGLGLVSGTGSFAAGRTATRAEAAVMLYNLMSR